MESSKQLSEIIEMLVEITEKFPQSQQQGIKREIEFLKELIMESRPPKIMIIGRWGAGKSSLVNAIFGKPLAEVGDVLAKTQKGEWYEYKNQRGKMRILDTRGLGDSSKPEYSNFTDALSQIKSEIKQEMPDAILFLCKAKDVDSHVNKDMKNIHKIKKYIKKEFGYRIPVLASVTQVDELEPVDVTTPPYDDMEKQENIQTAVNKIDKEFEDANIELTQIIPTSAWARYSNKGEIIKNRFWNIDKLVGYLIDALPRSAQLELARLSKLKSVQKKIAKIIIASSSSIAGGIAATPLPVADILPITTTQVAMITAIAYVSGRELNRKTALEFLGALGVNVGAGFAFRELSRALVKFFVPAGGSVISAGIAFGATWGIGEASTAYFIEDKSIKEAKKRFRFAKKKKQEEFEKNKK